MKCNTLTDGSRFLWNWVCTCVFTFTWNESEWSLSRPCFLMFGGLGMVSLTCQWWYSISISTILSRWAHLEMDAAPLFFSGYPRSASDSLKNKLPKQQVQASCGWDISRKSWKTMQKYIYIYIYNYIYINICVSLKIGYPTLSSG